MRTTAVLGNNQPIGFHSIVLCGENWIGFTKYCRGKILIWTYQGKAIMLNIFFYIAFKIICFLFSFQILREVRGIDIICILKSSIFWSLFFYSSLSLILLSPCLYLLVPGTVHSLALSNWARPFYVWSCLVGCPEESWNGTM